MSRAARTKIAHQDVELFNVELLETDQNTEDISQRAAAQYQGCFFGLFHGFRHPTFISVTSHKKDH